MRYERFVGNRYLMSKRRSSVLSVITAISIAGVSLGVCALIVVLSVMGGFKKDLKEKILGTRAHIMIRAPENQQLQDYKTIAESARTNQRVVGASPFLEGEVMVSSPTNLSGVILRGIDVNHVGTVSTLRRDMQEGKLEYLLDDTRLLLDVQDKRDAELDSIIKRIEDEKKEFEKEEQLEVEKTTFKPVKSNGEPQLRLEPIGEEEDGGMPPLPGQEDDDGMPALPGQDDEDDDDGMPALPGEEGADDDGARIPGLVIGPELAKSLQVEIGEEVNVVTPNGEMGPMGPIPRSRPFRIVGIFYSGMYEYDANYGYTSINDASDFFSAEGVTGIELKTTSVEHATEIAEQLSRELGPSVEILDWKELNKSLFYALELEKIAMFIVLTFIILVASFSIVAMLIMIVIEKGREIAILKSMGASNRGIMLTFVYQGVVIGLFGAAIGLLLGLGICLFLSEVGFPLDEEVYYINTLPVDVNPVEVGLVVCAAIVISLLATVYPSIQAAKLNPVDGLRYD